MAALTTQNVSAGGAITTAAAGGGADTIEAGTAAGGWSNGVALLANVGATATTITVDGTPYGPYTSTLAWIPVNSVYRGQRKNITYSQVASVTVAAVATSPAPTGITVGT
jgi:hypothetical protein